MDTLETIAAGIRGEQRTVERLEFLVTYYAGWSKLNAHIIRSAVADEFLWDDAEEGRIQKKDLGTFLPRFKSRIDSLRHGAMSTPYLTLSDLVIDRKQSMTTVWCCFAVPGTRIEGMSQIRVGDIGVICEHRAYRLLSLARVAGIRSRR